jgi:hypothetical protein
VPSADGDWIGENVHSSTRTLCRAVQPGAVRSHQRGIREARTPVTHGQAGCSWKQNTPGELISSSFLQKKTKGRSNGSHARVRTAARDSVNGGTTELFWKRQSVKHLVCDFVTPPRTDEWAHLPGSSAMASPPVGSWNN